MEAIRTAEPYDVVNSPFKWVGGKSRLRKLIVSLLPKHTCYVEPFAGAAWVLFAKPPSPVEILNDIDQNLTTFFRVVRDRPEELIASFDLELASRAEFERLASLDPSELDDVQRAHRFYYLIMAGWGGELNYPRFQTSISDGGHGNRLIGALKTVIIECLEWRQCVDRYDREGTVMYIDPPYPENGCNYAHNMRSWDEHQELAERLKVCKCLWVYSSYDIPQVRDMFSDCYVVQVQSASGMKNEKNGNSRVMNKEVLILNFQPTGQEIVLQSPQLLLLEPKRVANRYSSEQRVR